MVSPVTKYLCKNGYRQMIGSIVSIVAAARTYGNDYIILTFKEV